MFLPTRFQETVYSTKWAGSYRHLPDRGSNQEGIETWFVLDLMLKKQRLFFLTQM